MAIIKLQGDKEKQQGIYYEFDDTSTPLGEGGMGKVLMFILTRQEMLPSNLCFLDYHKM